MNNESIDSQYAKKLSFLGAFVSYYFFQKCYFFFHNFTKFSFSLDMSAAEITTKIHTKLHILINLHFTLTESL